MACAGQFSVRLRSGLTTALSHSLEQEVVVRGNNSDMPLIGVQVFEYANRLQVLPAKD